MKNYIQEGEILEVVTPSGGYTSGVLYFQGALFGVAVLTSTSGEYNQLKTEGVFELTKAASQAWAIGDPIHWDIANALASTDPTVGPRVGSAANVVDNAVGSTLGYVRLDTSRISGVYYVRKRFTTAQINAGATLLEAIPGVRYRMLDAAMIAKMKKGAYLINIARGKIVDADTKRGIPGAEIGLFKPGTSRIVLDVKGPVQVKSSFILPQIF